MHRIFSSGLVLTLYTLPLIVFSQGNWDPPGADPGFPRTLLHHSDIPAVRATLTDPEILSLFGSVWQNAQSAVPAGNSSDGDRINRAMIAKEAAFVVLMDKKYDGGTIDSLSGTERDALIGKVVGLLQGMNTNVGFQSGWVFYQEWQHRSKELITYLIAYDLLRGAGVSESQLQQAEDSLIAFTAHLYYRAMATYTVFIVQLKFFNYQFNNHSIMTASALGLAAIIFNDHQDTDINRQPLNWINAGLWNLDNTLWVENGTYPRVSEPDTLAGYAEGPGYFNYAFQNAFPFIRAMGTFLPDGSYPVTFNQETRQVPNPWYDQRYDRLYDWINKIRMPDGSLPAIHDSRIGFGTVITALSGKPEYNRINPSFTPDDPFIRTQYIATNTGHGIDDDSLLQVLPAAGSLVFRSSWDTGAVYMHFIAKHGIALTGAKSHHQGDATSFSLFAFGQLLAVDPGYPGSSLSGFINQATNHNLILVNGNGPRPPTGEFVDVATNTAYIENCFHTPLLDYGEVNFSGLGAEINRKNLFIRSKYFLLSDFVSSTYLNDYTFQLHGNGLFESSPFTPEGAFIPDTLQKQCRYTRDSVNLLAQVIAAGNPVIYQYKLDSLSAPGNVFRHYTKFLVNANHIDTTVFLTTLYPYIGTEPQVSPVFSGNPITATSVSSDNFHDFIFCTLHGKTGTIAPGSSGLSGPVYGNGMINFYSETTDGMFSSSFIQYGDSLIFSQQPVITADKKMDIAFEALAGNYYSGYVSDSGVIRLHSEIPLHAEQGKISSVVFVPDRMCVEISFQDKGNFLLAPGVGIDTKYPVPAGMDVSVHPNPSTDGSFTLAINSYKPQTASCRITDITGKILLSFQVKLEKGETSEIIDLSHQPEGCYILQVCCSSGTRQIKITKL